MGRRIGREDLRRRIGEEDWGVGLRKRIVKKDGRKMGRSVGFEDFENESERNLEE